HANFRLVYAPADDHPLEVLTWHDHAVHALRFAGITGFIEVDLPAIPPCLEIVDVFSRRDPAFADSAFPCNVAHDLDNARRTRFSPQRQTKQMDVNQISPTQQ